MGQGKSEANLERMETMKSVQIEATTPTQHTFEREKHKYCQQWKRTRVDIATWDPIKFSSAGKDVPVKLFRRGAIWSDTIYHHCTWMQTVLIGVLVDKSIFLNMTISDIYGFARRMSQAHSTVVAVTTMLPAGRCTKNIWRPVQNEMDAGHANPVLAQRCPEQQKVHVDRCE